MVWGITILSNDGTSENAYESIPTTVYVLLSCSMLSGMDRLSFCPSVPVTTAAFSIKRYFKPFCDTCSTLVSECGVSIIFTNLYVCVNFVASGSLN